MLELLNKFQPIYYTDRDEKYKTVNPNKYFQHSKQIHDNTIVGYIVSTNAKKYLYYYVVFTLIEDTEFQWFTLDNLPLHIECVVIELDQHEIITGVCYQPHGHSEHFWIRDQTDLSKLCKGNRPRVYISEKTHASYPVPGKVCRIYGLGNDSCNRPRKCPFRTITMCSYLLKAQFYGKINGFPCRLVKTLDSIPAIRLKELKYKTLLYKFW